MWTGKDYPAARTPLRSASNDPFTIVDGETGTVLGIAERERAYSTVHEGAVYLHLGEPWLVRELDLVARRAVVEPHTGDWYTQVKKETDTAVEEPLREERRCGLELTFGRVSVTERVVAYQRKGIRDQAALATVELDLPPTVFETEAVWYVPTASQLEGLEQMPTPAGVTARGRALDDRDAPAVGDVRPLGHRRTVDDIHPDPDGDGLRLRRPPRRRRDRRARVPPDAALDPPTHPRWSSVPATMAAPPACRARNAATSMNRSTRPGR